MSDGWAFVDPYFTNSCVEVFNHDWFVDPCGRSYPVGWLAATTTQEKTAIGLKAISPAAAVPAGRRAAGAPVLVIDNGLPVRHQPTEEIPIAELADQLLAAIRDKRWQVETAGVLVGETPVRTDEKSQAKINGAVTLFTINADLEAVDFESEPGSFVTIDRETMLAIGLAVGAHVQAAFSRSRTLTEAVITARDAADREALLGLDITTGWPS